MEPASRSTSLAPSGLTSLSWVPLITSSGSFSDGSLDGKVSMVRSIAPPMPAGRAPRKLSGSSSYALTTAGSREIEAELSFWPGRPGTTLPITLATFMRIGLMSSPGSTAGADSTSAASTSWWSSA